MRHLLVHNEFGNLWRDYIAQLLTYGVKVSPRGMPCREILAAKLVLNDTYENILLSAPRNLSYRFMVAEWLWIWFGREDVASIVQYNRHLAQFSDDGVKFAGAYGPPVKKQFRRMVETLQKDADSRQAIIQIYSTPTTFTRDVPCTLSLQFFIRNGYLHTIATMRSSDVWLGLPYDVFNFSMLANIAAGQLHVPLGHLTLNLGSGHLYESNVATAQQVLKQPCFTMRSPQLEVVPPSWLETTLASKLDTAEMSATPVWLAYRDVLLAETNQVAVSALKKAACLV